jgi:hypothetical protein
MYNFGGNNFESSDIFGVNLMSNPAPVENITDSKAQIFLLNELLKEYNKLFNETQDPKFMNFLGRVLREHSNNNNLCPIQLFDILEENSFANSPNVDLLQFFGEILSDLAHKEKMLYAQKQVEEAYCNKLTSRLAGVKKNFIKVDDSTQCSFCHKNVDNIISYVYPNAVLCDHSCTVVKQMKNICPLTGQNFLLTNKLL